MHQPYITDYPARNVAREAYLAFLSRAGANEKVKSGDTFVAEVKQAAARGKGAMAARIRDSI